NGQQSRDPLRVLQEHRRYRQRPLQVMEAFSTLLCSRYAASTAAIGCFVFDRFVFSTNTPSSSFRRASAASSICQVNANLPPADVNVYENNFPSLYLPRACSSRRRIAASVFMLYLPRIFSTCSNSTRILARCRSR